MNKTNAQFLPVFLIREEDRMVMICLSVKIFMDNSERESIFPGFEAGCETGCEAGCEVDKVVPMTSVVLQVLEWLLFQSLT